MDFASRVNRYAAARFTSGMPASRPSQHTISVLLYAHQT